MFGQTSMTLDPSNSSRLEQLALKELAVFNAYGHWSYISHHLVVYLLCIVHCCRTVSWNTLIADFTERISLPVSRNETQQWISEPDVVECQCTASFYTEWHVH